MCGHTHTLSLPTSLSLSLSLSTHTHTPTRARTGTGTSYSRGLEACVAMAQTFGLSVSHACLAVELVLADSAQRASVEPLQAVTKVLSPLLRAEADSCVGGDGDGNGGIKGGGGALMEPVLPLSTLLALSDFKQPSYMVKVISPSHTYNYTSATPKFTRTSVPTLAPTPTSVRSGCTGLQRPTHSHSWTHTHTPWV